MEMLGGMFVLGLVAAAHLPANQAKSQMDPGVAQQQAFFAASATRGDVLDLVQMSALVSHGGTL